MKAVIDRAWLGEFAVVTRIATMQVFTHANTCIATTRIGLEVLRHYGVAARPMPVDALADNLVAARCRAEGVPYEQWPDEAWSVKIDERDIAKERAWNGHLVLMVRSTNGFDFGEPRVLVDLTADQFARPHKSLVVGGPVIFGIGPDAAFTPKDPMGTILRDREGRDTGSLMYWPMRPGRPEANRWRESPDWTSHHELAQATVRAIIEELEHPTRETG